MKDTPPTSARHHTNNDGTVTVFYNRGPVTTYANSREASIESMLRMFPGASREWLERMHAKNDSRKKA